MHWTLLSLFLLWFISIFTLPTDAANAGFNSEALSTPLFSSPNIRRDLSRAPKKITWESLLKSRAAYIGEGFRITGTFFSNGHPVVKLSPAQGKTVRIHLKPFDPSPIEALLEPLDSDENASEKEFWAALRDTILRHLDDPGLFTFDIDLRRIAAFGFAYHDPVYDRVSVVDILQDHLLIWVHEYIEWLVLTQKIVITYLHQTVDLQTSSDGRQYTLPLSAQTLSLLQAEAWWNPITRSLRRMSQDKKNHYLIRLIQLQMFGPLDVDFTLAIQHAQGLAKMQFPNVHHDDLLKETPLKIRFMKAYHLLASTLAVPYNHVSLKELLAGAAYHVAVENRIDALPAFLERFSLDHGVPYPSELRTSLKKKLLQAV